MQYRKKEDIRPIISKHTVKIPLNNGMYAIVDRADWDSGEFPELKERFWYANRRSNVWHAACNLPGTPHRTLYMHKLLTRTGTKELIDHRDLDGLNNRRKNLRTCTKIQNHQHAPKRKNALHSKYKGVTYITNPGTRSKRWFARIKLNKKEICLGYFNTEKEAALAYNEAASMYFGDFAVLNVISK
jgi:hypothetical protein